MTQAFSTGDVVRLKSGGPKMTVVAFGNYSGYEEGAYMCKWFDHQHKLTEDLFVEASLEKVIAPSEPAADGRRSTPWS